MAAIVDTLNATWHQAGSATGRVGRFTWRCLSLSLADELIAYQKILSVALNPDGASLALGTRLLSRIKLLDQRRIPQEEAGLPGPELTASSVAVYLTEKKAPRTGIVISVPKSWAILKAVEFPAAVRENLTDVVAYEMDRLTPFGSDEVYYDFKTLSADSQLLRMVVIAARADRIDPYLQAFREKGLRVVGITTHLVGMETLCRYAARGPETVFLQVRETDYEGGFFQKGTVAGTLSGSFKDTGVREKAEQLTEEAEALLADARVTDPRIPVLYHLVDRDPALKELLKTRITRPVDFADETDWRTGARRQPDTPWEAVGALWSFLWGSAGKMNLLTRGERRRSRTPLWFTLPLLIVLGILVVVYWVTPLQRETQRLAMINKQIAQKKSEVKKVEALKKEIETLTRERNIISDFKNSRRMTITLLKELTMVIPKDSWLTRVRVSENQINIEGYAPSATLLVPKLEASPFFKKVEFASPTYRDPKLNQDRFQIKMEQE